MATKNIKSIPKKMVANSKNQPLSLFEKMNRFLEKHKTTLLWIVMITSTIISFFLFDAKVTMMGDDAEYVVFGYNFSKDLQFPNAKGPLYPILLSPFIVIFGNNVPLLKIVSAILVLSSILLLYKAFHKRIPNVILFSTLFLLSVNVYFLCYTNQILSEPLFMFVQALLLLIFFKYFIDEPNAEISFAKLCCRFLLVSFLILLLTLSRTVGYAAIGVVIVYFLAIKKWKYALYSACASGVVFGFYNVLKKIIWPASGKSYELSSFFTKDAYDASKGMEDFSGIIARLLENTNNYLSKFVAMFLGIRSKDVPESSWFVTLFLIALLLLALYWGFKKNKIILFSSLYAIAFCAANFIILHAFWQQDRIVLAFYPVILPILLSGIYFLFEKRKNLQVIYPSLIAILFCASLFGHTIPRIEKNLPILKGNLSGNEFAGLTPDWNNYLAMSRWAGENIPDSIGVAVRKPGTSCVYGNRNFAGIYAVPTVMKADFAKWETPANTTEVLVDVAKGSNPQLASLVQFVLNGEVSINTYKTPIAVLYVFDNAQLPEIEQMLKQQGTGYTICSKEMRKAISENDNITIYSPEELLDNLKQTNTHYMLLASIRMNPNANTGDILSTLNRYLYMMTLKYPNIAHLEHEIGFDEKAYMYKLVY